MKQNLAEKLSEGSYTYKDYLSWDTDEKFELFDGQAVMQARPSFEHQLIEAALITQLSSYLEGKKCRVVSEVEVLLPSMRDQSADDVRNVFVPDIIVVCEPEKITKQYYLGAPTAVMEILSPSTAKHDRFIKLNAYQQAGVTEYWIVSPGEKTATVYLLENGLYRLSAVYTREDKEARVFSLEGCMLDMSGVFTDEED